MARSSRSHPATGTADITTSCRVSPRTRGDPHDGGSWRRTDMFPLYFDDAEARVYRRHGIGLVRMRSYYAGAQGGAMLKIVPTRGVRAVLRDLDRLDPGLGRRYPSLPRGRLRRQVVQMENTRAHDVFAHFYTITFAEGHHVVTVEAYGTNAPVGRRRAVTYARRERDLLAQRTRG